MGAFQRVQCAGREGDACSIDHPGFPAHDFDFDGQRAELLALAKKRLQSLRAFSVADCFQSSRKTVAKALGWDQSKTVEAARSAKYGAHKDSTRLGQYSYALGADYIGLSRKFKNSTRMPWVATLPHHLKEAIRKQNYVDVEPVAFAKQLLYHRHGIKCTREAQEQYESEL